ncbi:MAG: Asp-tRNA(Asn)/Glu-tRNA(Gln) amidotransferase subunit GatB, partial [bacterium]|nr:Asp-tRNA(Asn)/Glu-tRNA(Gln) amidotransferase subunit GatB [bacterium]
MSNYEVTIGLEVHAELATRTKMFCDSLNNPDEKHPNTNVCPICMGHPGTLPVANKDAIASVIKVGLALNGIIPPVTKFDRKNYFYPDLPKGYQISQYDTPLVSGGELAGVRITRIHLEEDAGNLQHVTINKKQLTGDAESNVKGQMSEVSLVDYNRAGVPLMELVTEPDMHSAETAVRFAKELQLLLRYLGASHANMEKGQMRVEVNISLKEIADQRGLKDADGRGYQRGSASADQRKSASLGTKVEVKNINSIKAVEGAIAYEIKRQTELLEEGKGGLIKQETRGWDDVKCITVSQRSKENANDYRYFPDPD